MQQVKVIIVEDEPELRETNRMLLNENFPNMEVVGETGFVNEAVQMIATHQPDIVFMDIELEDGSGFQVLQKSKPYYFKVIFVTAYNQYAIKAIKFSAMDYILKPVNEFEFCNAVQRTLDTLKQDGMQLQLKNFFDQYHNHAASKKIVLRTSDALYLKDMGDIVFCKSDNSYTTFYFENDKPITVSKSIKEYADMLEEFGFIRPHQSYLVNLNCIVKIDKSDGGFVVMSNHEEIPIAARRKQLMMDAIDKL